MADTEQGFDPFEGDPLMLQSMGPAPEGGWQVTTTGAHSVILALADGMQELLDNEVAANYVEIRVKPAGHIAGYLLTVQRPDGKSPHECREEAEGRLTEALGAMRTLLDAPPHDTYAGRAGRTPIVHHRKNCAGCAATRPARALLAAAS